MEMEIQNNMRDMAKELDRPNKKDALRIILQEIRDAGKEDKYRKKGISLNDITLRCMKRHIPIDWVEDFVSRLYVKGDIWQSTYGHYKAI